MYEMPMSSPEALRKSEDAASEANTAHSPQKMGVNVALSPAGAKSSTQAVGGVGFIGGAARPQPKDASNALKDVIEAAAKSPYPIYSSSAASAAAAAAGAGAPVSREQYSALEQAVTLLGEALREERKRATKAEERAGKLQAELDALRLK